MVNDECPNCAAVLRAGDRYCAACGQEVIHRETFRSLIDQFMGDYFTFDSKIIRSIVPLLMKPGELTVEYLKGRRARYIPPLRMFIFLSIIFFLVIGWSAGAHEGNVALEDLQDQVFWDRFFASTLPRLFFLFLPLFALLVHLFYRHKPANFITPFILSAHFHAFVFLAFTIYALFSRFFAMLGMVWVNQILIALFIAYTGIYLWIALRKVFRQPPGRHTMKFISLTGLYALLLAMAALLTAYSLWS